MWLCFNFVGHQSFLLYRGGKFIYPPTADTAHHKLSLVVVTQVLQKQTVPWAWLRVLLTSFTVKMLYSCSTVVSNCSVKCKATVGILTPSATGEACTSGWERIKSETPQEKRQDPKVTPTRCTLLPPLREEQH